MRRRRISSTPSPPSRLPPVTAVWLAAAALFGQVDPEGESRTSHSSPSATPSVSFNFQIQPLLADNCFACHGPDEKQRKGDLRLDDRDAALKAGAIVPGKPESSTLVSRIFTHDADDLMPPADSHRQLSPPQKELLKRWIAEGAPFERHWAFIPPKLPPVPAPAGKTATGAGQDPLDAFVLAHLQKAGAVPAPPATRERWLRRVTFDLTGLPPTLAELDTFLADTSPQAFETVVDRLLTSRHFGERMATDWLDAARYADSYGRHEDAVSAVWPYRDWVIQAFNDNLPYDEFLLQQTAGDLLPRPSRSQLIATAFNRLVQQSNEAGSDEEEFRQEHVADRIKTNATAILGLTLECARCHDHKYDPLSQREYYQMAAFFNNIDELGLFSRQTAAIPAPSLLLMTPEQESRNKQLLQEIRTTELEWKSLMESSHSRFEEWVDTHGVPLPAQPLAHYEFESVDSRRKGQRKQFTDTLHPGANVGIARQSIEPAPGVRGLGLRFEDDNGALFEGIGGFRRSDPFTLAFWIRPEVKQERAVVLHCSRGGLDAASRGYEILLNDLRPEFSLSHFAPGNSIRIRVKQPIPLNEWTHLTATYDGSSRAAGLRFFVNGHKAEVEILADHLYRDILYRAEWGDFDPSKLQDNIGGTVGLMLGYRRNDRVIKNASFDDFKVYDRALTGAEALQLGTLPPSKQEESRGVWAGIWYGLTHPFVSRAPAPRPQGWYEAWLRDLDPQGGAVLRRLHQLRTEQDNLVNDVREIMVMQEMPCRRPTHVLARGQFDQPGEEVFPATPAAVLGLPPDLPRNRLGLARWYVDRSNPLTARVAVNRLWQVFFGRGIVGTTEDFGLQGQLPTHPELLDWLAVDFMDHGWDVKRFCRRVVLSSTYRQSSRPADPRLLKDDPENRLLARGPRHRLTAEMVRDQALAVSGLLVTTEGGPPVHPYIPDNLYEDSGIQDHYEQDHGPALWRRSLYTFWKRTLPPPTLSIFDAPTREYCRVRRETTSTPMQSLALMNAPEFLEAARVLAERLVKKHPADPGARVVEAFRLLTSRTPSPAEVAVLVQLMAEERQFFSTNPAEAESLRTRNGEHPADNTLPAGEVAATAMMTRTLLGSDEALMEQ